jgi:hypothetical protein
VRRTQEAGASYSGFAKLWRIFRRANFPTGEDAMDKAERALPIPEHAANNISTSVGATVEQLRAQLYRIIKAEG